MNYEYQIVKRTISGESDYKIQARKPGASVWSNVALIDKAVWMDQVPDEEGTYINVGSQWWDSIPACKEIIKSHKQQVEAPKPTYEIIPVE